MLGQRHDHSLGTPLSELLDHLENPHNDTFVVSLVRGHVSRMQASQPVVAFQATAGD